MMSVYNKNNFELITNIGRLKDINEKQLSPYDAIYIGDPFCSLGVDNLLENKDDLRQAIGLLKRMEKRVYLSTYVEPWTDKVKYLMKIIEIGLNEGIDAVGVADLGVLRLTVKTFKGINIHIANFVNCFNSKSVRFLSHFNVKRIAPYPELSLGEIDEIRENSDVDIELQVHGKIPLGYTETCIIDSIKASRKTKCSGMCYDNYIMRAGEMTMKAAGRVPFGLKDLCMLGHLNLLLAKNYRYFRVESLFETGEYRKNIGQVYRETIEFLAKANKKIPSLNLNGVCNGFYFERPGIQYVF